MHLIISEFLRIWSRRSVKVVYALLAAILVLIGFLAFVSSDAEPPDTEALAAGQREQCREMVKAGYYSPDQYSTASADGPEVGEALPVIPAPGSAEFDTAVESCVRNQTLGLVVDNRYCTAEWVVGSACAPYTQMRYEDGKPHSTEQLSISVEDAQHRFSGQDPNGHRIRQPLTGHFFVLGLVLSLIAAFVGATLTGAEYRAGTIESLAVVEPRRFVMWGTKFLVSGIAVAVFTVGAIATFLLATSPARVLKGNDTVIITDLWSWVGTQSLIIVAGCVAFAWLGMSLALLGRNTAAGIGITLAYFAISTVLSMTLLGGFRHYDLIYNWIALLGRADVTSLRDSKWDEGSYIFKTDYFEHAAGGAWVVVAVTIGLVMLLSALAFKKRDISS